MSVKITLGLQHYAIIIPVENSYIKFKNNKINSLQRNDIPQNYWILQKVVKCFSQHNLKISKHRHVQKLHQGKCFK
jgi:hypothetical protein